MHLNRVGILAPGDSVADFPTHYRGNDAAGLLAGWTAAWRPGLIVATGRLPELLSEFDPPPAESWASGLVIACGPSCAGAAIEWLDEVRISQAPRKLVVEGFVDRASVLAAIDRALPELPEVPPEIEAEFFALGYAYVQVATLTRALQDAAVFNRDLFQSSVVAAAEAAIAGQQDTMQAAIERCYDQLLQARNHTYPVDLFLLDVVLTAETTFGESLVKELTQPSSKSVVMAGHVADCLAVDFPESLASLQSAIAAGHTCVAAGGYTGEDLSTLPPEVLLEELQRGQDAIARVTGTPPTVFGQRASSLGPRMPRALSGLGYDGALAVGFDGGEPPTPERGRTTWMGIDGTGVEVALATPHDLGRPETLLNLTEFLAATLQGDRVPTVLLAGWPGARHAAFEDLRLVAQRSEVLGRLVTLEEYFQQTSASDHWGHFELDGLGPAANKTRPKNASATPLALRDNLVNGLATVAEAVTNAQAMANEGEHQQKDVAPLTAIAASAGHAADGQVGGASLVVNPWSFPVWSTATPVSNQRRLEVPTAGAPALGYCLAKGNVHSGGPTRVDGLSLRNEHLKALVHQGCGGLQSLRPHDVRRNHASQRVVITRRRGGLAVAEMQADLVEVAGDTALGPGLRSIGRLVNNRGDVLAKFTQTIRLPPHARELLFDIDIDAAEQSQTFRDYHQLAFRLALGDADWLWSRGLQWAKLPIEDRASVVASDYLQARHATTVITLACDCPLAFRRIGAGRVDALLPWGDGGHSRHRFALSLHPQPALRTTLAGLAGAAVIPVAKSPQAAESGWWLHCSAASVVVSHLSASNLDGESSHRRLQVRLVETEGRAATARLRFCRPLQSAHLQRLAANFGERLPADSESELPVEEGAAVVEIGPYGWLQVEAAW
ncbi:MAG: hypothetical protein AAGF31_07205 [Planctomycetota bacterium]